MESNPNQEGAFLDNEANYQKAYDEAEMARGYTEIEGEELTEMKPEGEQVIGSFVKEHNVILNYVYDLLIVAAKKQDIAPDSLFAPGPQTKRSAAITSRIRSDTDRWNFKQRVSQLLSKY